MNVDRSPISGSGCQGCQCHLCVGTQLLHEATDTYTLWDFAIEKYWLTAESHQDLAEKVIERYLRGRYHDGALAIGRPRRAYLDNAQVLPYDWREFDHWLLDHPEPPSYMPHPPVPPLQLGQYKSEKLIGPSGLTVTIIAGYGFVSGPLFSSFRFLICNELPALRFAVSLPVSDPNAVLDRAQAAIKKCSPFGPARARAIVSAIFREYTPD